MKPILYLTRPLAIDAQDYLGEDALVRVNPDDRPLTQTELIEAAQGAQGLISMLHDPIDVKLLDALPELKVIANVAVGYNNIDVQACAERNITVCNTPGVLTNATADIAWTLILACTRRVREGERMVRAGQFDGWGPNMLLGPSLQGKTLGIYGMGRIGQAVARRAIAFGMDVIYHNRRAAQIDFSAQLVSKEDLLKRSDILSLHAPLTPQTQGAFGRSELEQMKPSAVLINTARGPMVDEAALVRALDEGTIWGAGLDVYELEPVVHAGLIDRDDVVLLPHLGSATTECRQQMARMAFSDALAVIQGDEPKHEVMVQV
jgi:glyoxylate reductase